MKLAAIMQPTYLPWCGYFEMVDRADVFVLLDTVQFSRQSWQQRNRVRLRDGREVWLTVPVSQKLGTRLDLVEIVNDRDWQTKHWRTIEAAYSQAAHWQSLAPLELLYDIGYGYLANYTADSILTLNRILGINTPILCASELGATRAGKIERLQDLLALVEADALLEPKSASYLKDAPFPVEWHDYHHPVYTQDGQPFSSHLSVVDLIAHHGPDSLRIIRNGRDT